MISTALPSGSWKRTAMPSTPSEVDANGSECYYVPFDTDTLKQIKSKLTGDEDE